MTIRELIDRLNFELEDEDVSKNTELVLLITPNKFFKFIDNGDTFFIQKDNQLIFQIEPEPMMDRN